MVAEASVCPRASRTHVDHHGLGENTAELPHDTNSEYLIGAQQRNTIFMELLPAEAKAQIEELIQLGRLKDWAALRQLAISMRDQTRITSTRHRTSSELCIR